jgi:hypothetical protein
VSGAADQARRAEALAAQARLLAKPAEVDPSDWDDPTGPVASWMAGNIGIHGPALCDLASAYRATVLPLLTVLGQIESAYSIAGEDWADHPQGERLLAQAPNAAPQALLLTTARLLAEAGDELMRALYNAHADRKKGGAS